MIVRRFAPLLLFIAWLCGIAALMAGARLLLDSLPDLIARLGTIHLAAALIAWTVTAAAIVAVVMPGPVA